MYIYMYCLTDDCAILMIYTCRSRPSAWTRPRRIMMERPTRNRSAGKCRSGMALIVASSASGQMSASGSGLHSPQGQPSHRRPPDQAPWTSSERCRCHCVRVLQGCLVESGFWYGLTAPEEGRTPQAHQLLPTIESYRQDGAGPSTSACSATARARAPCALLRGSAGTMGKPARPAPAAATMVHLRRRGPT